MFTNYENGILQLSASIHHYFRLETGYAGNPKVDQWIEEKGWKRIFTILIDGMGSEILQKYADKEGYFYTHMVDAVQTVYPPTTAAATTAFRCGLSPSQTGWLGWNQHFKEVDDEIILFYGCSQYGSAQYGSSFAYDRLPVLFLEDRLAQNGIEAASVWPAWGQSNPCRDYADILQCLQKLQEKENLKYVYAYWDQFDTLMHIEGPSSSLVKQELDRLDCLTQSFIQHLSPDTGVIILADHGQLDVENINLLNDPILCACLSKRPSLESRTVSFFLKEGSHAAFVRHFQETYGAHFLLLSHQEVLNRHIFGPKTGTNRFEEFIGDYVAFATDNKCLIYDDSSPQLKGQHAGTTQDEMMIPIILND